MLSFLYVCQPNAPLLMAPFCTSITRLRPEDSGVRYNDIKEAVK